MEKMARKLASNISSSLGFDDEKEAVIAYGLIAIIQITITIVLVLLFGLLVGAPVEALIICLSVSIFRKYSGGAHAKSAELCTSFSVLYCTLTAAIAKRLLTEVYYSVPMALALIVIFSLSFFIVYKYAPVDSPNKPIRSAEKKNKMRKGSFIILSTYLIISVLFFILSNKYEIFKSYGISMLFGISWQIFTLTSYGAKFIEKMNKTINL
ncbi:MAG: accessory regulator AgrB [Clostridia bacterium]|nr:accessory regulator AgrB [Clostridia bacterium]